MRSFQDQQYTAPSTVELSTHYNGSRRDVLAGLKKKAISFRNNKSNRSQRSLMTKITNSDGNNGAKQGRNEELGSTPRKVTSPTLGGNLKKVIRRGKGKKTMALDENGKENSNNWTSPVGKRNNKDGSPMMSFYKKADQAKQSKQKEHSESRRTLLLSSRSRSKRNAMSTRTIYSTPDTVATGLTSAAYSMRSIMTPMSSVDTPKNRMEHSVVSLESSTVINSNERHNISTRTSASVATTVVGSHHSCFDEPKTPSSTSTSSIFPPHLEHRQLREHHFVQEDELTVQTSPQWSDGRNNVVPTTRRLSPILGTPSPSHSFSKQNQSIKRREHTPSPFHSPSHHARSPFSTTSEDSNEDATPVKELFVKCTPSAAQRNASRSRGEKCNGQLNEVAGQQKLESSFVGYPDPEDGIEGNELMGTFDDDDDQTMDENYDEEVDENLADLLQSMGPFSNHTKHQMKSSPLGSSRSNELTCLDLPQTLIRQGMFSRAISLLRDSRFIEQRHGAQQGHWASTTRLHISDLKYLSKTIRRKHEQNQKQVAAEASLLGTESTCNGYRAAFIAQRRAVSMQCVVQQQSAAQEKDDKQDLLNEIPSITLESLRALLSVVIAKGMTNTTISRDYDIDLSGAFPTKITDRNDRKINESKDQLMLMEVVQMCTKYLRRCDWNQEALMLYDYFIGAQQKQLDYSNTHVAVAAAKIFVQVGRLQATLEEYVQAVSSYQVALGLLETTDNRVDYCATLVQMGHLHCRFGALEESLKCYQDVYDLQRMVFGESSLEMGFLLNNIGVIERHLGRLEDALQTYTKCHSVLQLQLTSDHIHVAHAANNIAGVLRRMGRYEEAMNVYRHALEIKQRHLPPCHPSISLTHAAMGATLRLQERGNVTEEAMKHYRAAMK